MKLSIRLYRSALLIIFFTPMLSSKIKAESISLGINQTVSYPAGYTSRFTVDSSLFSLFALVKSPDQIPTISMELYSYGFKITPIDEISVFGGSISTANFPNRVKNPVFSVGSPFYAPVTIPKTRILTNGSTKDTGNAALEIHTHNWSLVGFSDVSEFDYDPAWILLSKNFPAFDVMDTSFAITFFEGTFILQQADETSWYLLDPIIPKTRIYLPAVEVIAQNERVTASCAGFGEIAQYKKPSLALRADASFNWKLFRSSAGVYSADSEYINLQGKKDPVLRRIFFSPSLDFPSGINGNAKITWGGIIYSDTHRRTQFYERENQSLYVGGGTDASFKNITFQFKAMQTEMDTDIYARTVIKKLIVNALLFDVNGHFQKASNEGTATLMFIPAQWLRTSLGLHAILEKTAERPELTAISTASCGFRTHHLDWKTTIRLEVCQDQSKTNGSLRLETVFK